MRRFEIAVFVLGAAAAALVLWATAPHGPAMYQLGMHNAVAAECLLRGETMLTTRGDVFAQWPPLLPLLFALGRTLGASFETTARLLDAASLAAIVALAGSWSRRLFGVPWAALTGAALLATQPTLFDMSTVMSSEPPFLAFVLGALFAAHAHAARPSRAKLAAAIALTAAACLQRYIGVVLIGVVAVLGVLHWPRERRWRDAALFAVLSAAPLAIWIVRNLVVAGAATGERPPADFEVESHLADARRILWSWWLGEGEPRWAITLSAVLHLGLIGAGLLLLVQRSTRSAAAWILAFPLAYAAFLVAVASLIWLDPLDVRLLSPLLVFGCVLAPLGAHALGQVATRVHRAVRPPLLGTIAVLGLVAVVMGLMRVERVVRNARTVGPGGFGTAANRASELIGWLREHPFDVPVYSNAPEHYAYATWRASKLAPVKRTGEFLAGLPEGELPLVLVWASPTREPTLRGVHRRDDLEVETIAELSDGAVYRISRR